MNNVEKALDKIGRGLLDGLKDAIKVAQVAEPFVDLGFPAVAGLYNSTVATIASVKTTAAAAIVPGASDLDNVIAATTAATPIIEAYAKSAGLTMPDQTTILKYMAAGLASLKLAAPPAS